MNILTRLSSPEPEFFKVMIKWSLMITVGSAAVLTAEKLGQTVLPEFSFTLLPWVSVLFKNLLVAGLVATAVAKTTIETEGEETTEIDVLEVPEEFESGVEGEEF